MPRWTPFVPYFWGLVEKTKDCWVWKGDLSHGYGRVHWKGKRQPAHRVSWELTKGKIPKGLFACHHCDNKQCVNPAHIFLGTQKDNMQDWTRKGLNKAVAENRLAQRGDAHWKRTPKGKVYVRKWAKRMKEEFKSGRREIVRGPKGRILGSRVVS